MADADHHRAAQGAAGAATGAGTPPPVLFLWFVARCMRAWAERQSEINIGKHGEKLREKQQATID